MSGIDLVTALGRLLTNPELRGVFNRDPAAVARRLVVAHEHLEAFLAIDHNGLETQSRALVTKRYHEVARLLPVTIAWLGEDSSAHFFDYAAGRWPKGHRRHLEDAIEFCAYLGRKRVKKICRAEYNRLRFVLARRRWAVHFVPDFPQAGRTRPAIQLLVRWGGRGTRQGALFIGP